jgi:ParB family chromosome partitioning protein
LAPEAKDFLQHGQIEMGHARAILGLAQPRQGEIAAQVAAKNLNVRDTEALVRKLQEAPAPVSPAPKTRDPDIVRLEERVTQSIGAKAEIKHGDKGGGKLIISYDSLDQLEGVLERLG